MALRRALRGAIAAGVVALAGCASATNCDPNQTGFLSGVGCEVGGGYGARQTQLERDRNAAEQVRLQELAYANHAAAEQASAQQALRDRLVRLAALRRQTEDMQRRLDEMHQRQGVDAAAVQRAEAELQALRHEQAALPPAPSEEDVRAAEERRRAVLHMINEL